MIDIRPVWQIDSQIPNFPETQINELLEVERAAIEAVALCAALALAVIDESHVQSIDFLHRSAKSDLVAGCELARAGYLKQAYSLWRSWFEQSLFSLYFIEAPLHREAWKVSSEIALDDNPPYRLMLHQLLMESGERHPFSLVYGERYMRLAEAFKMNSGQIPKNRRPIARAVKVLTALSQGVHGTYQPVAAASLQELCDQLSVHCTPILRDAVDIVVMFWLLLLTSQIDLPPDLLVGLREGSIDDKALGETGLSDVGRIANLAPLFKRAFANI